VFSWPAKFDLVALNTTIILSGPLFGRRLHGGYRAIYSGRRKERSKKLPIGNSATLQAAQVERDEILSKVGLFPETKAEIAHNGPISLYTTPRIGEKQGLIFPQNLVRVRPIA
jgi:hypothetical protein